jgi:hypothetical protein
MEGKTQTQALNSSLKKNGTQNKKYTQGDLSRFRPPTSLTQNALTISRFYKNESETERESERARERERERERARERGERERERDGVVVLVADSPPWWCAECRRL